MIQTSFVPHNYLICPYIDDFGLRQLKSNLRKGLFCQVRLYNLERGLAILTEILID